MTRFEHRLQRNLEEIADHAAPTNSRWEKIRTRIDKKTNDPEVEVIMLEVKDSPTDRKRGKTTLGLMGVAAGLLVAIVATSLVRFGDDQPLTAGTEAERVVTRYIEAFNDGDVSRAISLFAPNAALTDEDPTFPNAIFSPTLDQWESLLSWYAPQDTQISDPDCTTSEAANDRAVVRCSWRLHDAVTQAVGGPGDPVEIEWTIVGGTVVAFDRQIVWSDQEHTAFLEWVSTNHPNDQEALLQFPYEVSATEARRTGELIATYAAEWGQQIGD